MPDRPTSTTRTLALMVLLTAAFMDLMDVTILNVTLPTIQTDLHANPAALEWMLSGYTLALTVGLISGARLGDFAGHKRVFVAGVAGFSVASGLCSLSLNAEMLVGARIVQGLFAAAMIPQVLAQIQLLYPAHERGPAMAAYASLSGIAATIGPVLGGALVSWNLAGQSWRLVFWVNVPVGALAAIAAARVLPADRHRYARRPDLGGVVILGLGLGLILYPLIAASGIHRWTAWAASALIAGLLVIAGFCIRQRRIAAGGGDPLVDLSMLRRRSFTGGLVVQLLFLVPMMAFFLTVMQFLQHGLGMTALHAGATMLPWSVTVAVLAGIGAAVLAPRLGRLTIQLGLVLTMSGLTVIAVVVAHATDHTGSFDLLPGILLGAAGMGLVVAPLAQLTLADVPETHAATGSGLFNTTSQLGASVGVATVGTLFFAQLGRTVDHRHDLVGAYGDAFSSTLYLSVGLLAIALAVSFALPSRATAQAPASAIDEPRRTKA